MPADNTLRMGFDAPQDLSVLQVFEAPVILRDEDRGTDVGFLVEDIHWSDELTDQDHADLADAYVVPDDYALTCALYATRITEPEREPLDDEGRCGFTIHERDWE